MMERRSAEEVFGFLKKLKDLAKGAIKAGAKAAACYVTKLC